MIFRSSSSVTTPFPRSGCLFRTSTAVIVAQNRTSLDGACQSPARYQAPAARAGSMALSGGSAEKTRAERLALLPLVVAGLEDGPRARQLWGNRARALSRGERVACQEAPRRGGCADQRDAFQQAPAGGAANQRIVQDFRHMRCAPVPPMGSARDCTPLPRNGKAPIRHTAHDWLPWIRMGNLSQKVLTPPYGWFNVTHP